MIGKKHQYEEYISLNVLWDGIFIVILIYQLFSEQAVVEKQNNDTVIGVKC